MVVGYLMPSVVVLLCGTAFWMLCICAVGAGIEVPTDPECMLNLSIEAIPSPCTCVLV